MINDKNYQTQIPNLLSIDLLRLASITSKMTAPQIYIFLFLTLNCGNTCKICEKDDQLYKTHSFTNSNINQREY